MGDFVFSERNGPPLHDDFARPKPVNWRMVRTARRDAEIARIKASGGKPNTPEIERRVLAAVERERSEAIQRAGEMGSAVGAVWGTLTAAVTVPAGMLLGGPVGMKAGFSIARAVYSTVKAAYVRPLLSEDGS